LTITADAAEFSGTERFRILGRIGQGGMGVVYRAWDRERRAHVALKALRTASAETLFRFKNEFRALADLHHPNLCALGELFHDGGRWFFTMELVDGVDLLAYVRPPLPGGEPGPLEAGRLRRAIVQLGRGLDALHARGRVHRDIKPSNVLVSMAGNEERVVLVDFGLTTSLFEPRPTAPEPGGEPPSDIAVVGTVDYMAPEQAASRPAGPEADWYSVGVILYEALTGQMPFQGAPLEVLIAKQQGPPPPVRVVAPDAPRDLASLCDALLAPDPRARPRSDDIVARLRGEGAPDPSTRLRLVRAVARDPEMTPTPTDPIGRVPAAPSEMPFVGRARELITLEEAFAATLGADGQPQTVVVHGESGVGKSALVRRFLDGIWARQANAVVLTGRCLEQESVPYKAVDGVVDTLARVLRRMPRIETAALLPLEAALLGQVFPVLRRVPVIAEAPARRIPAGVTEEQQALRARVFGALRELLTRLAARRPLVIAIDDLQWADDDSLALLAALLREPEAPQMMALFTLRAGATLDLGLLPGRVRHVHVARLPADEAAELARLLLGADPPPGAARLDEAARTIATEAQGHPLFIDELVRHARLPGAPNDGQPLHLDDALRARIAQLPAEARRLLDVIALAGLPIGLDAAAEAAGLPTPADPPPFADTRTPPPPVTAMIPQPAPFDDGVPSLGRLLTALRAGRLVRTARAPSSGLPLVEPFHDRVRDATLRALEARGPEVIAELHGALARALETRGADAETLSRHLAGAGDHKRAAELAARAAEDAIAALAFDRAARLLRRALELDPTEGPTRAARAARLGEALAALGRSGDAALAYLEAARDEPERPAALSLQNRAAQLLLVSGHVDEGLVALDAVLRSVGLAIPETPRAAMRSFIVRSIGLRLRGVRFRERSVDQIAPEVLRRIDACWSVASGLGMVDIARAAAFDARHLAYALSAGEPRRVARALALHGVFQSALGAGDPARADALCARAEAIAERIGDAHSLGLTAFARGVRAFLEGNLAPAHDALSRALTIFHERCVGVAWERSTALHYALLCHLARGDLGHVVRRMPELRHSARERGDLYQTLVLRTGPFVLCALAEDDPERGRTEAQEALATWSQQGFQLQHLWELTARAWCDLYSDDGRTAHDRIVARWPTIERSLVLRVPYLASELYCLRGRAALAATARLVASDPERRALIGEAERYAARLAQRKTLGTVAQAALLRAGIAATRGDSARALAELEAAERGFFEAEMHLHRAVAARRRGQLLGDEGAGVVADAEAWMATQRVKSPRRMCALFAPGFGD
jgi:tetratricopeptide (TPR) repeat protein